MSVDLQIIFSLIAIAYVTVAMGAGAIIADRSYEELIEDKKSAGVSDLMIAGWLGITIGTMWPLLMLAVVPAAGFIGLGRIMRRLSNRS